MYVKFDNFCLLVLWQDSNTVVIHFFFSEMYTIGAGCVDNSNSMEGKI